MKNEAAKPKNNDFPTFIENLKGSRDAKRGIMGDLGTIIARLNWKLGAIAKGATGTVESVNNNDDTGIKWFVETRREFMYEHFELGIMLNRLLREAWHHKYRLDFVNSDDVKWWEKVENRYTKVEFKNGWSWEYRVVKKGKYDVEELEDEFRNLLFMGEPTECKHIPDATLAENIGHFASIQKITLEYLMKVITIGVYEEYNDSYDECKELPTYEAKTVAYQLWDMVLEYVETILNLYVRNIGHLFSVSSPIQVIEKYIEGINASEPVCPDEERYPKEMFLKMYENKDVNIYEISEELFESYLQAGHNTNKYLSLRTLRVYKTPSGINYVAFMGENAIDAHELFAQMAKDEKFSEFVKQQVEGLLCSK